MSIQWKQDQKYLLNSIEEYRNKVAGKDLKEAKRITVEFSETLHKQTPELHHRTVNSITERLPYLDNLLAGAHTIESYAKKDQSLYATEPRKDNNKKANDCNGRHSYNGAVR